MNRTFIIAEAGVNHNGSVETARRMIDVAAAAGVDAVKFQTFRASLRQRPNIRKRQPTKTNHNCR